MMVHTITLDRLAAATLKMSEFVHLEETKSAIFKVERRRSVFVETELIPRHWAAQTAASSTLHLERSSSPVSNMT
jgi:hypothetical protein